jgi:hypothetical protein
VEDKKLLGAIVMLGGILKLFGNYFIFLHALNVPCKNPIPTVAMESGNKNNSGSDSNFSHQLNA